VGRRSDATSPLVWWNNDKTGCKAQRMHPRCQSLALSQCIGIYRWHPQSNEGVQAPEQLAHGNRLWETAKLTTWASKHSLATRSSSDEPVRCLTHNTPDCKCPPVSQLTRTASILVLPEAHSLDTLAQGVVCLPPAPKSHPERRHIVPRFAVVWHLLSHARQRLRLAVQKQVWSRWPCR
jgi:hypothetical protein